mgnify:CR=1 FL=1
MKKTKKVASTKALKKAKRAERYGMVKVAKGQKVSFISYQNKHGWSLGLALNGKTVWLRNTRFSSLEQIKAVVKSVVTPGGKR